MEGIKKPEQAIFDLTLSKLGVQACEAVFLDDLGYNLKTARLMGMTTIKVGRLGCALCIVVMTMATLYQVSDISDALHSLEQILENAVLPHPFHVPGTSEVSPKLQLPVDGLVEYLRDKHGLEGQGEGLEGQGEGPVLRQFRHGQSNPTYYLAYGGHEMVLRKKPVSRKR